MRKRVILNLYPFFLHRVLARHQGHLCASCGRPVESPEQRSIDDVIPRSLGGQSALGNLVMVHGRCNAKKADRLPTGCELIWLMAVNARLGVGPTEWRAAA